MPIWVMDLADPLAKQAFDAKIVGVSMGAALPKSQYVRILKYALPVNLIVRYMIKGNANDATFYPKGQQMDKGHFHLKGVDRGSPIKILTEKKTGEREVLTSFAQRAGEIRCGIAWEISFNGWTKIWYEETDKKTTKKHQVYRGYPHWRSKS